MPADKRGEDMPLLPVAGRASGGQILKEHQLTHLDRVKVIEEEYWEDEDDDENAEVLFADGKKRGTSLILNDTLLLILHYLQLLAVLQSLGLRWPWPEGWLRATRFIFLFNLDIWDFMKVQTNGSYVSVQNYYTNAALLPFQYWHLVAAWAGLLFLLLVIFIIAYIIISTKKSPFMFIQIANLQRAYIIIAQVITIPFGIVIARLFHCNIDGNMDVDGVTTCWRGLHWAFITPCLAIALLFYILLPVWLVRKVKSEMLNMTSDRHEGYLQLKETEYVAGLDILWVVAGFHIFSSFKKKGCHMRAAIIVCMFCILIMFAGIYSHIFAQAVSINMFLLVMMITFLIIRPFRVSAFNYFLFLTYLCLVLNCMMGTLVTSFDSFSVRSIWLTPTYLTIILSIINAGWLVFMIVFVLYLIIRHCTATICCHWCYSAPLWPSMTSSSINKLTPDTQRYIRAILKGRFLVEKSLKMHPIFAPAHEIARHIHIINAYLREAEYLRDPMHGSLWDLLDDLIEAHEQIAPKSLFAESVKTSIRYTAKEFMKMMPAFVRRLAQREYDFILMHPTKRRLLLKMYCLGLFLNGRRQKVQRERLNVDNIQKIWKVPRLAEHEEYEADDGYYEDMYPIPEEKPTTYRPATTVSIVITDEQELDDEAAIEQAEQWAANHPVSPSQGQDNKAYEEDELALLMETDSVNLSQMLDGIPSPPSSARASSQQSLRQGDARPLSATSHHSASIPVRPSSAASRPGSAMQRPSSATPRPSSATLRPSSANHRSGSAAKVDSPRPGSATPRVASLASVRSGSAGSGTRSPRSGGGEEGRSTPLPGQVDDEEKPPVVPPAGESQA